MSFYVKAHEVRFRSPTVITSLHVCLIVLLGMVCYYTSLSVPFMFDDFISIVNNPDVIGGKSLWNILLHGGSRRIADISFAINYRFLGLQVVGFHATNIAIHLSVAIVLYFLSASLLDALQMVYPPGAPDTRVSVPVTKRFIPLATALVFVCHPLQTQAVTYLVQRHTSLATLFYLLALLSYIKGRMSLERNDPQSRVLLWFSILAVSALLALHTKQIAYSLPLMIIMLELGLFRGRQLKRSLIVVAATGIVLFLSILLPVLLNGSLASVMFDLRHLTSEDLYLSRTSYFLTQSRVLVTYLRLLVLPVHQNLDYDYPIFASIWNAEVIASLFMHVILLTSAFVLYRRSENQLTLTNNPYGHIQRVIAIGIAWFYIGLIIESSFIPITDVIMEHRVYLPSVGFCLALAAFAQFSCSKFHIGVRFRWLALTAVCLIFSMATIARNRLWSDDMRFWQDVANKSPHKGRVTSNLGWAYLNHDKYEIALRLFVDAIRHDLRTDDNTWIMLNSALKGIKRYPGRFLTGEEYLTPAGKVDLRWYSRFNSIKFNNMGLALEYLGCPEEALKWYVESLNASPDFDLAWFNLGLLSARLGNTKQGNEAILKLETLNPGLANNLASYIRNSPHSP